MRPTLYSRILYRIAYWIAWVLWQVGGKQIRRGFMRAYHDIDRADMVAEIRRATRNGVCDEAGTDQG